MRPGHAREDRNGYHARNTAPVPSAKAGTTTALIADGFAARLLCED